MTITYTEIPPTPTDVEAALQGYLAWKQAPITVHDATQREGGHVRGMQFCREMLPGDEMWTYQSPDMQWARRGYMILRKGRVVQVFSRI